MALVKSSFLPNVVEEITHGSKDLLESLVINSKFVWNIPGWGPIERGLTVWIVDLKIWIGQEILLQTFGSKEVIGKM